MIDRRIVVNFMDLNEAEEKLISENLIEYFIYYSKHVAVDKQPDAATVYSYYKNIMKPASVEALLSKTGVKVDVIRFIEQYYNPFVMVIGKDKDPIIIDKNKDYDRDMYIRVMKYLLEKHRDKREVGEIVKYLRIHGLRDKELSDDYVRRIVKRVYEVC